jgi:drug/metabolite transporter (DMT)-like permease
LGLGLALLGVLIVQGSSLNVGGEKIWGNSISLLSGFCVGLSYVFSAKIREETGNTVYGRSLFLVAAITIGIVAVFMGDSLVQFQKEHIVWLIFLGLVPSILGHNMLNYAIKYLSPTTVASVPLGEPIIATILGYLIFAERVPFETILGGPIILCGIYIILKSHNEN